MDKQSRTYQAYVQILKEELIPAMGCTEPIAIAYASARVAYLLDVPWSARSSLPKARSSVTVRYDARC